MGSLHHEEKKNNMMKIICNIYVTDNCLRKMVKFKEDGHVKHSFPSKGSACQEASFGFAPNRTGKQTAEAMAFNATSYYAGSSARTPSSHTPQQPRENDFAEMEVASPSTWGLATKSLNTNSRCLANPTIEKSKKYKLWKVTTFNYTFSNSLSNLNQMFTSHKRGGVTKRPHKNSLVHQYFLYITQNFINIHCPCYRNRRIASPWVACIPSAEDHSDTIRFNSFMQKYKRKCIR
ncbi:hypothetical protein Leryth_006764 [Lithospermum erythrorhizon]|nr:hypothetical protein Leryth_006764 [Lithospermum erythrorhizon]